MIESNLVLILMPISAKVMQMTHHRDQLNSLQFRCIGALNAVLGIVCRNTLCIYHNKSILSWSSHPLRVRTQL